MSDLIENTEDVIERAGMCAGLNVQCRNIDCDWRGDRNVGPKECPKCGQDRRCRRNRVPGFDYCRAHGGANERHGFYGAGTPSRGGGKSKWPIANLAAKYVNIIENPEVVSVRGALGMVRARTFQLFERIDQGDSPERMKNLIKLWEEFKDQTPKKSWQYEGQEKAYADLDAEFEKAYHDYAAWDQIVKMFDMERKLTETELKVFKEMRAMMTAEQGYELAAKLTAVIMEVVEDDRTVKEIIYKFARIVGDDDFIESQRRDAFETEHRPGGLDTQ